MYGIGLFKGLGITMKNLVSPGRQFNVHQYPNRKASPLDLAKISDSNAFAFIAANPIRSIKSLMGLETIVDTLPQHPRLNLKSIFESLRSSEMQTGTPLV